jgi:hypothetical protein
MSKEKKNVGRMRQLFSKLVGSVWAMTASLFSAVIEASAKNFNFKPNDAKDWRLEWQNQINRRIDFMSIV